MTLLLPQNLTETDDVAVEHVAPGAVVHRPGVGVTGCGLPMWSMQHPLPAAGLLAAMSPHWCEHVRCFPRESAWERMVAAAHPNRPVVDTQPRDGFRQINQRHRGFLRFGRGVR